MINHALLNTGLYNEKNSKRGIAAFYKQAQSWSKQQKQPWLILSIQSLSVFKNGPDKGAENMFFKKRLKRLKRLKSMI